MKKKFFISIASAALLLFPVYAQAETTSAAPTPKSTVQSKEQRPVEQHPTEQFNKELDSALDRFVDKQTLEFDVAGAQKAGTSEEVLEVGTGYNDYLKQFESCEKKREASDSKEWDPACLSLFERWNWCGKCHTNGGTPQNSADRICMNHDKCLTAGRKVCDCDKEFVNHMKSIRTHYSGRDRAYIEAAIRAVPTFHGCW